MVATALEHMQEASDIGVDISVRVIQGVANACLGREMDDALRLLGGEHRLHDLPLGELRLDKMESIAALEPRQTCLFE